MSWLSNEIRALWAKIMGISEESLTYIETTVVPVLKTDAGALLQALAPIAQAAVAEAAAQGGTLTEAQKSNAISQVKSTALAAGIGAGAAIADDIVATAVSLASNAGGTGTSASGAGAAGAGTAVAPAGAVPAASNGGGVAGAAGSSTAGAGA